MDFPVPRILEAAVEVMHSAPQECVQNHSLEQIGDVLPLAPRERVLNRKSVQNVDVPVPQFKEDGVYLVPQEHVQNLVCEQIVDEPVPPVLEEGFSGVPQERVQNRTPVHIVDVPLPQTGEERVQNRTHEQIVDSPVPQIMEAGVQVSSSSPQERVQNRTPEQIMDVLEPRILEAVPPERIQDFVVEQISVAPQTTENSCLLFRPSSGAYPRTTRGTISVVPQTTGKYGHVLQPVPSERIQERLVHVGFIKGLDRNNMSTWRCYGPCASDHGGRP